MIFVTHDQVEAMTLGDRIVIMRDGWIQQAGRPLDLYDRPTNVFVAAFIGSPEMNLVEGELLRDGGGLKIRSGDLQLGLPDGEFVETEKGVTVGIRPEHIVRAEGASDIEMIVSLVEQIGAQTYVLGTIFGQKFRAVFARDDVLAAGDKVPVILPAQRLHMFSRENGRTLRQSKSINETNNGRKNHDQAQLKSMEVQG